MNYNFKNITAVPTSDDMINIILSKTQRKTPTVVHPGYSISRIRNFYMRKIKFTQTSYDEKLSEMLEQFPKLDDIHPFYGALINVLYDKDHFKLALGHCHSARSLVNNIAKDYVKLMKYADSLYRCKMLKRAALGRMATMTKKLKASLGYLEEVRKHMARLPTINPYDRTLLLTGFPNVGKSSFINNITNANVDVQPYPFTTQSLYIGHTDHNYVRWQVIDSPGLLDHNLEERNTIEMQAITALAHLKACVLFLIDLSETCGYTIQQQITLFNNIKPLFINKPLIIVLTKTDLCTFDKLSQEDQDLIKQITEQNNLTMVDMSNINGDGVQNVKTTACELLLKYRLDTKADVLAGGDKVIKADEEYLKGMNVTKPKPRDKKLRTPTIPQSKLNGQQLNRPTLRQIQDQMGGAGVFNFPLQEHFDLENPEWKYDIVPEIMDGKNIADFVDKDILKRLADLEKEEEMLDEMRKAQDENDLDEELDPELMKAHAEIKNKKALFKIQHKMVKNKRAYSKNKNVDDVAEKLESVGIDSSKMRERVANKTKREKFSVGHKRKLIELEASDDEGQMVDENEKKKRSVSRNFENRKRSQSRSRQPGSDPNPMNESQKVMDKLRKKIQKSWSQLGKAGEADNHVPVMMPKHLFSGKQGFARDRR